MGHSRFASLPFRSAAWLSLLTAVASCAPIVPRTEPPPVAPAPPPAPPPPPINAIDAGVAPGPALPVLDDLAVVRAVEAFALSCPALLRREDSSGLTLRSDWEPACSEAGSIVLDDRAGWARAFLDRHFALVRVGDGSAFSTGYFEPEIAGSRVRAPGYEVPVYRVPDDLVEADAAAIAAGAPRRGRLENGAIVPYHDRAAIEEGALAGRGLELAWAADPVDLFFLHIQGSGRLKLPDGSVMRIGYAGQNGRDYLAIGRVMKERGLLAPGRTSMQDLVAWLRANPDQGREIMRENKSYIFFRELTGPGPIGSLGVPVTPRVAIAADSKFVTLGAPVLLSLDRPEASGLWIAQDTGGAIKGPNRFDTFWGAGEEAALIAGGMQGRGTAYVLVPKASAARLARGTAGGPPAPR